MAAVLLLLLDRGELLAELGDAVADLAPVELEGGFAGPLAALPLFAARGLAHAGGDIVEARDLDLEAGFAAAGVAVEDLDDDARTVEDFGPGGALQVSRLAWGDVVVYDDEARLLRGPGRVAFAFALVVVSSVPRRAGLAGGRLPSILRTRLGLDLARARRDDPGAAR